MFLFYHSDQSIENRNYYKGILFEKLLSDFLTKRGFVVELRKKKNSLEYDLDGTNKTTSLQVVGEAKAYNKNIGSEIFTSFVGKLLPLGIAENKITGLFLSLTSLTAETNDYYQSLRDNNYNIIVLTGQKLFNEIRDELEYVSFKVLERKLHKSKYDVLFEYQLITNNGFFLVHICKKNSAATPAFFIIFNKDGETITDETFIQNIKKEIKELSSLNYISSKRTSTEFSEKVILNGLIVGQTWIDYRLPAGPKYFVGREVVYTEILTRIDKFQTPNIIQIKSRSGVGKSSLLAFLDDMFKRYNVHTELHDARDIKSVLDLFYVIQRFTKSNQMPKDFRDVEEFLKDLEENKDIKKSILLIDQFESTFSNPSVYNAYESIANYIVSRCKNIFLIIARKSDQLTTYDESKISLEKLNTFSKHYQLLDFTKKEAALLLRKISEATETKISHEVQSYILEFTQGFPWLLKRTIAHILKLIELGASQKELFASHLKLDNLFDEELQILDEAERDYLTKIAIALPAEFTELHRHFDEDPLLTQMLDKLTRARLLRLSGSTYDTYNDVFKDYLKYNKLPEFRQLIIYRWTPNSIILPYHKLISMKRFSVDDIQMLFCFKKGTSLNLIREFNSLNLVVKTGDGWEIPQRIMDIYKEGRLGEYIRKQLYNNHLVTKLLNKLSEKTSIHLDELPEFLNSQFPFGEATKKTWDVYANILIGWLTLVKIIDVDESGEITLCNEDRNTILAELGNLTEVGNISRRNRIITFFPSSSFSSIKNSFNLLKNSVTSISSIDNHVINDFKKFGWLKENKLTIENISAIYKDAKTKLSSEDYTFIWEAANSNKYLFPLFKERFGELYSDETIKWKLRKIISWGKNLGIIENKRYRYIKRSNAVESKTDVSKRHKRNQGKNKIKVDKSRDNRKAEFIWELHYQELLEFIDQYGHSSISRDDPETKTLAYWATAMRTKRKKGLLDERKIDLLNKINFDWDPIDNSWKMMYEELKTFFNQHGNSFVPKHYENQKLSNWLRNQKNAYRKGKLSKEREELLNQLGAFNKSIIDKIQPIENDILELLLLYKEKYGNIKVPQLDKEFGKLGRWINGQRILKKRGKISKEREEALNNLGMVWDAVEERWDKRLNELHSFYLKNGHFNVPRKSKDFPKLGDWYYKLRVSRPNEKRIAKLKNIGFDWDTECKIK